MKFLMLLISFMMFIVSPVFAEDGMEDEKLDGAIVQLQHDWARANYHTPTKEQEAAFKSLTEKAHQITASSPNKPEAMIWEAIVLSGYAKAKGGLSALKYAEQARDLLLAAAKLNPQALHGSAYTSLGSLHYKVPGWPVGFGSDKKAREYLEKALQLNPNGIDPNYFYADFLMDQHEYAKAVEYFNKALNAPPRRGREDADAGRRMEIEDGLKHARAKM